MKQPRSVNIEGVFLHVLGDALGAVGAMISGACIWWLPWEHKYIIDPITSVVIGLVIMTTSIPLGNAHIYCSKHDSEALHSSIDAECS